jgi:hypothetical protein
MSQCTREDIHFHKACYVALCCETHTHYIFVINNLQYQNLDHNFFHDVDTGDIPSPVSFDEASKDYLQDTYDH